MKITNQFTATMATIVAVSVWALLSQSASAQITVFTDNFGNGSTLNQTSTPGGTPTASSTSYDVNANKGGGVAASIAPGDLQLDFPASSSGFMEAAAIFTSTPLTLQNAGDYIDFVLEFTDTANLTGSGANQLNMGLFDSHGVVPITTNMSAGATITQSGGTQFWSGYTSLLADGIPATTSKMFNRPAQGTGVGSQTLLFNTGSFTGGYGNPAANQVGALASHNNLTNGVQYTEDFRVGLNGSGSIVESNMLYLGTGTGGQLLYAYSGATNSFTDTTFDSLAFGYGNKSTLLMTQDVSFVQITTDIVPEPSTWMLLVSGFGLVLGLASRRRRN